MTQCMWHAHSTRRPYTDAWETTMGTITNKLNQVNFRYAVFAYWLCLLVTVVLSMFNGDHDYDRRHNEPVLAMEV
jgi:hypothetical protein